MIPDHPLLQRFSLKSGLSDSTYDPYLLMTKIAATETTRDTLFQDTYEYNASLLHEWTHWLQHHGTSYGIFLSALRFSQEMTTLRWFRAMPKPVAHRLLRRRNNEHVPVLSLEPNSQRPIFEDTDSDDVNLFRQIWYDHQWIHGALDNYAAFEAPGPPPGSVFGEIIGDVMLAMCGEAHFSSDIAKQLSEDPREARCWYTFSGRTPYIAYEGRPFTSRMIMETAATVAEMELLPGTIWEQVLPHGASSQWQQRLRRLLETDYGVPIKALLTRISNSVDNIIDILPTINAICFAALNPPLPPLVMCPPKRAKAYSWEEIYPPLRFMKLASVVGHVGFLKRGMPPQLLALYLADLCDAAELTSTLEFSTLKREPGWGNIEFSNRETKFSDNLLATCHDYTFWAQMRIASERTSLLSLLVCPGECLSGDLSKLYLHLLIPKQPLHEIPYIFCPLHWTTNDKVGFSCRDDFGNWLLRSALMSNALFDAVVGAGNYDLSKAPPEVSDSDSFATAISNNIERNLLKVANV